MAKGQRDNIKMMHGRTMRSSNTNHVSHGEKTINRKSAKTHQVATQKATIQNKLVVNKMNLRSAMQNQAAVRALM